MSSECALLYSGGTDSTSVAVLAANEFRTVHLLTFKERATSRSPVPSGRVDDLRAKFGADRFRHEVIDCDALVRRLSYHRYARSLWRHGLYNLATPGLSALSWHMSAIEYCRQRNIVHVRDGVTRELTHFPNHMDFFLARLRDLYGAFGMTYANPVRDWDVPYDQQFFDRLLIDHHGFTLRGQEEQESGDRKTTGRFLFEQGLSPTANIKGSLLDHQSQADCYPFVLYNIFCFCLMGNVISFSRFKRGLETFFDDKFELAKRWLLTEHAQAA